MAGPRDDRATLRSALIDAAARLIAAEGATALTLRRVADEVGTSTMAIYTHFGGMQELRRAVRSDGFARLAAHLKEVETTKDPVADLSVMGLNYLSFATTNPDLYRVMFMEKPIDDEDAQIGWDAFDILVGGVQRCIDSGRFREDVAKHLATQLWAQGHGVATLHLAQKISFRRTLASFGAATLNLFIGYGDQDETARRSLADAIGRSAMLATDNRGS